MIKSLSFFFFSARAESDPFKPPIRFPAHVCLRRLGSRAKFVEDRHVSGVPRGPISAPVAPGVVTRFNNYVPFQLS